MSYHGSVGHVVRMADGRGECSNVDREPIGEVEGGLHDGRKRLGAYIKQWSTIRALSDYDVNNDDIKMKPEKEAQHCFICV